MLPEWVSGGVKDDLTLVFALISALIPILVIGWRWHRRRSPYRAQFSQFPHGGAKEGTAAHEYTYRRETLAGPVATLYLRVWPKMTFHIEYFDVRLIERRSWRHWRDAPTSLVAITDVRVPQWENISSSITSEHGTVERRFQKAILWTEGIAVTLEIVVSSTDDWCGRIVFRSHASGRRSTRLPLRVCYWDSRFFPDRFRESG